MSESSDTSNNPNGFTAGDNFFGQMREAGVADDTFIQEIVEMFLDEGASCLQKIDEGFLAQNTDLVRLYAHKLKSSFLMFDMEEAHSLALNLEKIDAQNFSTAQKDFGRLKTICNDIFQRLRMKYEK